MTTRAITLLTALAIAIPGCGEGEPPDTGEGAPTSGAPGAPAQAATPADANSGPVVLELVPERSVARYRVREQLVNVDLPNDAVGETTAISGRIALDGEGRVIPSSSSIVVEVGGLTSDRDRRDGYVRGRLLRAEDYPTVELGPTAVRGLPFPIPRSGTHTFELDGVLTVLDATRPTTWQITATFDGDSAEGSAGTRFSFDDFGLTQPRVPVVLSVADTIGLELDFAVTVTPLDEPGTE